MRLLPRFLLPVAALGLIAWWVLPGEDPRPQVSSGGIEVESSQDLGANADLGVRGAAPDPDGDRAALTRLRVVSKWPRPGDRVELQEASGEGLGEVRSVDPGVWAMVRPGAHVVRLLAQDGAHAQASVHVAPGQARTVELMAASHAVVRGRLIERNGTLTGPLEVWFLPPGREHPSVPTDCAGIPHTRASAEGVFESPELEPGAYRISVGPMGGEVCSAEVERSLVAGRHEVEVHLERGCRTTVVLDPEPEQGGLLGTRLVLQRRVRRGDHEEADERAWRKVATLGSHRFERGRALWSAVPTGRYRLVIEQHGVRHASAGFEVTSRTDLELRLALPDVPAGSPRMHPRDPAHPWDLEVHPFPADSTWSEGVVWLR